jgi:hypothetical protein
MSRKVIAIDFDGTLTHLQDNYHNMEIHELRPNETIINYVRALHSEYHFIVIFTARLSHYREEIAAYLNFHKIPFDLIHTEKLRFDVLIDDRTLHPSLIEAFANDTHHQLVDKIRLETLSLNLNLSDVNKNE